MISEFPLLVFSLLAGSAAGLYVAAAVFFKETKESTKPWLLPLVACALLGLGLLGTLGHLQHPERFLNALANPLAMISQEAYWSILFGIVLVIDFIFTLIKKHASRVIRIAGAIPAFLLMSVTGIAYATSWGVEAWAGMATVPLFIIGDLVLGTAIFGVFAPKALQTKMFAGVGIVLQALLAVVSLAFFMQLGNAGYDGMPVIVSLVVGPVASIVCCFLAMKEKMAASVAAWAILLLTVVAACIVRYAFYAACPF